VVESEPTKDSTDAVCTVAASKLLDIVTVLGRERDVEVVLVSRDMIFHQVLEADGLGFRFNHLWI
jgi:hypothetical protein